MISDPPFSRMDLISCRNLLIYLSADLQKRVVPVFHYALNPNGYLFLGTSESVGEYGDLFTAVDRRWRSSFANERLSRRASSVDFARPLIPDPHGAPAIG